MNFVFWALVAATVVATYVFWVRPLLRTRPTFKEFYDNEEGFFASIALKFAGLKQKLLTAVIVAVSAFVTAYDTVAPFLSGVQVQNLTDKIPQGWWPVILGMSALVLLWFRKLAEKRDNTPDIPKGI